MRLSTVLYVCLVTALLPGCVGGDAARTQRDPRTVQQCFERAGIETSPARGLLAEEADVGATAVRFPGGNEAKVVIEQTEQAARRTAENFRAPAPLDPPRVRQGGSVVVVYDKAPQPEEERIVSRCTGVRG